VQNTRLTNQTFSAVDLKTVDLIGNTADFRVFHEKSGCRTQKSSLKQ
jgi:hypothetical protein